MVINRGWSGPSFVTALYIALLLVILSRMLTIAASRRDIFGKKLKTARVAGQLPVVVYGYKKQPQSLFVPAKEFKKLLATGGESGMVSVQTPEGQTDVLIHEVAWHPVSGEAIHADLLVVDKTQAVEVNVPLRFEGLPPAVKDLAGILVKVLHELKVEVLPAEIPHDIEVNVESLVALDSQILVKDLNIPKGVKVLGEPEAVVASVTVAKEEPVEAPPVDLAAIEVEKKGKKDEEGAEAGEKGTEEKGGENKKEEGK